MKRTMHTVFVPVLLGLGLGLFVGFGALKAGAADISQEVGKAADATKETVAKAERSASEEISRIWQRVDEKRLVNRTPDEIVAWVLTGMLVGGLAGLFMRSPATNSARAMNFVLGLVGAFIGGILVHVFQLDFGLGPVLIRYEELLLSLAGALVILLVARFGLSRLKHKP